MGTATTAPLRGPGRSERASVTRFIRRAFRLNIGGAPGSLERRAFKRFAAVIPIANMCGSIDIFLFLWFVAPLPVVDNLREVRLVNAIAFAVCLVVTLTICGSLSTTCARP